MVEAACLALCLASAGAACVAAWYARRVFQAVTAGRLDDISGEVGRVITGREGGGIDGTRLPPTLDEEGPIK